MLMMKKTSLFAAVLLVAAGGCVELDIGPNPNDPDAERALASASDVEALIGGSYTQWWNAEWSANSLGPILSIQSFQHSAFPANFGMYAYSLFPRAEIVNDPAHQFYLHWNNPWIWNYRALSAVANGFQSIDQGLVSFSAADEQMLRAYGRFVQGLAHASLAIVFDQGFILDETTDISTAQTPVSYNEMMAAALGYFDQAISIASGASFELDPNWMSRAVSADELVQLAHSYKARYRAAVARNWTERQAVNWNAVIADVDAGITADWAMSLNNTGSWGAFGAGYYILQQQWHASGRKEALWSQLTYMVLGMADQSGRYQRWIAYPEAERHPNLGGDESDPFIIITPDTRFPQGADLATQQANPGKYYFAAQAFGMWGQPARGSWRWSYYLNMRQEDWFISPAASPDYIWVPVAEMQMLKAEAYIHNNDPGAAAAIISASRTANGLSATDAAGTNTSCVPKLRDESCGGLLEMMKWEKRLETQGYGLMTAPWYFDSRGWGDLYRGTQLQFPMPCREAQVLGMECYTFGGVGGDGASPGSSYAFPGE